MLCCVELCFGKMASQKTTLTDEEIFSLIKEYEQHPCLWQKSHQDYKNNFKKIDAINAIAVLLNLTAEFVKDKCRSLRTIYFQNVQKAKKGKSGSGASSQPRWKFYSALSFLQSEVADCGSTDNLDLNAMVINWIKNCDNAHFHRTFSFHCSQNVDDADATTNPNEIERPTSSLSQASTVLSQASSTGTPTNVTPLGKKRKYEEERRECWTTLMESIRPQNAHEEFGSYVSSSLAQIKDDNLIQTVKCKIQIILSQAMTEFAQRQLTSSVQQIFVFESDGRIVQDPNELIEQTDEIVE